MRRWPLAIALTCVLVYLALSLDSLAVFPPVGEDEPWIAAAAYKLATRGVYGSDLFAGYYGVDRHDYQHMPLYPLVQAASFKLWGVGVTQMRLLPVACGFVLLLATFAVGRQAGDDRVGTLALVLMIGLRVAAGAGATGVLLLDRARINRYDIAVPVLGLLSLWAFQRAERDRTGAWYVASGALAGLASLSHLYGAFWLAAFFAVLWWRRGWRVIAEGAPWLMLAAAACTWLPWALYVASGWSDYLGQMRFVADRFDVFNPAFYASNVLHGDGPISLEWAGRTIRELPAARLGTWTMLLGLPAAWGVMLWRTRRRANERALAMASLAQLAMFVVLLKVKTFGYMIALWPSCALCLAWFGIWLWDRGPRLLRVGLLALLFALLAESGLRVAGARDAARHATPYDWYEDEVGRCIPEGSLVLGLQQYWLGLRQHPYRTWLLPASQANPLYHHQPVTLDRALDRIDPDVMLIDRHMAAFLEEAAKPGHPNHPLYAGFQLFVTRRRAAPACVVRDPTYGTMVVYRVPRGDRVEDAGAFPVPAR